LQNKNITQAVILAGGYGKRLRPFTDTKPKPMYEFEGIPFLGHLLKQLKCFGITEVVLLLGYLSEVIQESFGNGDLYGIQITYDVTPAELETGGRLKHAYKLLSDNFLLLYCDNYCPFDLKKAEKKFFETNAMVQLTAYTNRDDYTKNNLLVKSDGRVLIYDKERKQEGLSKVDIGYAFINKKVLELIPDNNVNFEETVYPKVMRIKSLYAYCVEHRYYSVGSWERIHLTKEFFRPKKVAFLDRDGTLNVKAGLGEYILTPDQFVWLGGAMEALKILKQNGYLLILITNQPGIARGSLSKESLDQIHKKMQDDLAQLEIAIDYIYVCPHGWDDNCFCRKPKPGLLFQAQQDLSLNLSECIFFGDDKRDIEAGVAAECMKTIQVTEQRNLFEQVTKFISTTLVN